MQCQNPADTCLIPCYKELLPRYVVACNSTFIQLEGQGVASENIFRQEETNTKSKAKLKSHLLRRIAIPCTLHYASVQRRCLQNDINLQCMLQILFRTYNETERDSLCTKILLFTIELMPCLMSHVLVWR